MAKLRVVLNTACLEAGVAHLTPLVPIVWSSDAKLGLVLGGPPDLLPTQVVRHCR